MQAHHIVSRITGPLRTLEDDDAAEEHIVVDSAEDKLTDLELDALWRNERPFGRDSRHAPIDFVPARFKFDDFGQLLNPDQAGLRASSSRADGDDIGSWYSSLQRSSSSTPARIPTPPGATLTPSTTHPTAKTPATKPKPSRNDWFIQKVLSSEPPPPPPKPATLSDMLEREPPTGAFKPPVWTVIGPGNRGFTLLQRHGWEEGNALGAAAGPSRPRPEPPRVATPATPEIIDLTIDDDDDDRVVDLTRSQDGDDDDDGDILSDDDAQLEDVEPKIEPEADAELLEAAAGHGTALLVPLPAFLKPNKHGIGVRAEDKRKLRLKSTAQAIAATTPAGEKKHQQIIDAARKRRLEVGRGARGFARLDRSESTHRQAMMAYLNS